MLKLNKTTFDPDTKERADDVVAVSKDRMALCQFIADEENAARKGRPLYGKTEPFVYTAESIDKEFTRRDGYVSERQDVIWTIQEVRELPHT